MRVDARSVTISLVVTIGLAGATWAVRSLDSSGEPVDTGPPDGRVVFLTKGCTGCHTIAGVSETGSFGPNLTALAEVAPTRVDGLTAEEYVRQSILDPQAFIAPGFGGSGVQMPALALTGDEVDAVVGFLLSSR